MTKDDAPFVDCHFHVWTRDMPLTSTAWHAPPTNAPLEDLVRTLDEHGVIFGVIAAASIHGNYHDYSRAALKAHRRLRATALLPPTTDIRQMEQMNDEGFVGVRLMWSKSDTVPDLRDTDHRVFLRRIRDLGWHVHLVDRPDRIADSIAAIEESGARLVIDHMGHLETKEGIDSPGFKAILAALERGNTWVKISGRFRFTPRETADPFAAALLRVGTTERILWGSDWPFAGYEGKVSYADVLKDYEHLVPDPDTRRQIDATALRFYFA